MYSVYLLRKPRYTFLSIKPILPFPLPTRALKTMSGEPVGAFLFLFHLCLIKPTFFAWGLIWDQAFDIWKLRFGYLFILRSVYQLYTSQVVASHFWSRDWPTCRWHHLARKSARFLADGKFVCLSSSFSSVRSRAHPASISLFGISASFRREEFIYVAAISFLGPQNLIGMLGFNLKWTWTSTRSLMILMQALFQIRQRENV